MACCLGWVLPPRLVCGWQCPTCVSLCTIRVLCSIAGVRCFSWYVCACPGLLALQGLGVLPFSFFSGLFCFVFLQIPWLCCTCFGGACWGFNFPLGLPCLSACSVSIGPEVSLISGFMLSCFLSFGPSSRSHPAVACSRAFLVCCGCLLATRFPGMWLCALPRVGLLCGVVPVGSSMS